MNRLTDIEIIPKQLTPIYGYLEKPLVSLDDALASVSSEIDQFNRFIKAAKNRCHYPSEHGLTQDESAAIYLYTMDWGDNSFFRVINDALRANDRSKAKPWLSYLKLFHTAVQKLPGFKEKINLWRGIKKDDISKNYKKDDEFTWWAISSCTTSMSQIKCFLGENGTLFLIEAKSGKQLLNYSSYPLENEVILCSGTRFRVMDNPITKGQPQIVHLKEITGNDNQQTNLLSCIPVESASKCLHQPKFSSTQIDVDAEGNRYEVLVHIYRGVSQHY